MKIGVIETEVERMRGRQEPQVTMLAFVDLGEFDRNGRAPGRSATRATSSHDGGAHARGLPRLTIAQNETDGTTGVRPLDPPAPRSEEHRPQEERKSHDEPPWLVGQKTAERHAAPSDEQ